MKPGSTARARARWRWRLRGGRGAGAEAGGFRHAAAGVARRIVAAGGEPLGHLRALARGALRAAGADRARREEGQRGCAPLRARVAGDPRRSDRRRRRARRPARGALVAARVARRPQGAHRRRARRRARAARPARARRPSRRAASRRRHDLRPRRERRLPLPLRLRRLAPPRLPHPGRHRRRPRRRRLRSRRRRTTPAWRRPRSCSTSTCASASSRWRASPSRPCSSWCRSTRAGRSSSARSPDWASRSEHLKKAEAALEQGREALAHGISPARAQEARGDRARGPDAADRRRVPRRARGGGDARPGDRRDRQAPRPARAR